MKLRLNEDANFEEYVSAGLSDILIDMMNKKWSLIRDLNSIKVTANDYDGYESIAVVVDEMVADESKHIGSIEGLLGMLTDIPEDMAGARTEVEVEFATPMDEGLLKPRRHRAPITEETDEEAAYYVSYYIEDTDGTDEYTIKATLKNSKGFDDYEEAIAYLRALNLEERGFVAEAEDYYVKRNPNGPEKFYVVESELGEQSITD